MNMKKLHTLPHRVCESTCYVNGLEDLLKWKGVDYTDFLLSIVGGMAGFTYLRFKRADPPCMVYWGSNPKYLMKDLGSIIGFKETVIEGKTFRNMFLRLKAFLDNGQPVVAGALDMYYLNYYPELYRKLHVPIHYVLVVGYDDAEKVLFVHDCSHGGVQRISYDEFEKSLNINVPGMSKKNTIRAFTLPHEVPSEFEVAKNGFSYKAERFLHPPVKLLGIPAMRKLVEEIVDWENGKCFKHMVTRARAFWQAYVLNTLGEKYNIGEWTEASKRSRQSGKLIIELCRAALKQDKQKTSNILVEVADVEEKAYNLIKNV
jgi:hypothetical protein